MQRIIVIGSVNRNHLYSVPHIVRPGETIASESYRTGWGGKGLNQAIALAKAGAQVSLIAKVGHEDYPSLSALCSAYSLDISQLHSCALPTGHALIQLDSAGQNCIIVHSGANGSFTEHDIQSFLTDCRVSDIFLLQNEINSSAQIISEIKKRGGKVALNPSPFTPDILHWPLECLDYLILNESEAASMTGTDSSEKALEALCSTYPALSIFLTLGSEGSCFACGNTRHFHPTHKVNTVDTTGAGDTYTGFLLAELARGSAVEYAMSIATEAACLCVTRPGAVDSIPSRSELPSRSPDCV